MLDSYMRKILESQDFAKYFSEFEKNAINKNREGAFAIVRHLNSEKYVFTPDLILGSEIVVSRIEGIKYAQDIIGGEYQDKSLNFLVNSPEFIEETKKNGVDFAINVEGISKAHSWKDTFTKRKYYLVDEFIPYLHIHNHLEKKLSKRNTILPSQKDLENGFNGCIFTEEFPFYFIIFGDKESERFPFLLMKFDSLLEKKSDEGDIYQGVPKKAYLNLINEMARKWAWRNLTKEQRLLETLFNKEMNVQKEHYGFRWEYLDYYPEERKIR